MEGHGFVPSILLIFKLAIGENMVDSQESLFAIFFCVEYHALVLWSGRHYRSDQA